jgi:hypothetical protein
MVIDPRSSAALFSWSSRLPRFDSVVTFSIVILFSFQALPNQQTVDYPSFKLVIVGDGGTGKSLSVRSPSDQG